MLQVYTLDNAVQWDNVVKSFKYYDVYYLSGYVKAFEIHGDGMPLLLYYEGKGNDAGIRGINVVMKRDVAAMKEFEMVLPKNKYFDVVTPYGYGGWLIEGTEVQKEANQLFIDYERWCQKEGIVADFVRFHPVLNNHNLCSDNYTVIPMGETIAMDLDSPEVIWENIVSKNRNVIRKAIKNDIRVYYGRNPKLFTEFKAIYDKTMDKDFADEYYYFETEFYNSVLEDLPENAIVFYAQNAEGRIVAASIILATNGYMNYHLSGSLKEYGSLAPTNLLLYKAALWGSAHGYKSFYLGGGVGSSEDSLFKFKRSFYKGELHRFYIGKKVIDVNKYDELCNIVGKKSNSTNLYESGFFPEYRA